MLSIVIPVFNSAAVVGETVDRVVRVCEVEGGPFEVIVVNDGSTDDSLAVLRDREARWPTVRVLDLGRNTGQHAALLTGLRAATGSVVVCLDDDLQHAPEDIPRLLRTLAGGHDAVFARFAVAKHPAWRRPGSAVVRAMDRLVFGAPHGLSVSSFRAFRREVVDRVCAYRGGSPYVRGQVLLAATSPANVDVEHHPRRVGRSGYTTWALVRLVLRVLLEWSPLPGAVAMVAGAALPLVGSRVAPGGGWAAWLPGVALVVSGAWQVRRCAGTRRP